MVMIDDKLYDTWFTVPLPNLKMMFLGAFQARLVSGLSKRVGLVHLAVFFGFSFAFLSHFYPLGAHQSWWGRQAGS